LELKVLSSLVEGINTITSCYHKVPAVANQISYAQLFVERIDSLSMNTDPSEAKVKY